MATKSDIFDSTLELFEAVSVATNQIPLTQSQDISQHKFCLDVGTFFKLWSWQQSQITWLKVRICSSWVCGNKTQYFCLNVQTISSRSCSKNVSAFISLCKGCLNILNHWNVWKNWPTERFNWDYLLEKLFHRQRLCCGETSQKQLQTLNTAPRPQCENSWASKVKQQQQKVNLWWMFSHGRGVKSCRKFISGGYRRAAGRSVSNQTWWRFTENIIIKNCFRMILRWRWEEITPHEAGGGLCGLTVWMYYQYYLLIMLLKLNIYCHRRIWMLRNVTEMILSYCKLQ